MPMFCTVNHLIENKKHYIIGVSTLYITCKLPSLKLNQNLFNNMI
jgi:hypothetical protein